MERLPVASKDSRRRHTAVRQFRFAAATAYFVRGSVSAARRFIGSWSAVEAQALPEVTGSFGLFRRLRGPARSC
jgi:hypothetical protein